MPTPHAHVRRPKDPGAADPAAVNAVDVALCRLLQALQVDRGAVHLTPDEEDALLTRLRQK